MTYLLDLGSTKVSCLAATVSEAGDVLACAGASVPCRGLSRGVIQNLDATADAIREAIARVRAIASQDAPTEVVVNVSGSHVESMNAQGFVPIYPSGRTIAREDLLHVVNHSRQIVSEPDRTQILAMPREYRVDGVRGVTNPLGFSGTRLEVITHILTGSMAHIQNVENAVQMAGYKVAQVIAQPIASGYGVATQSDRELGCAVVDIGGGSTSICVFQGGAPAYSVVLPVGGSHVTSDLSKLLKTAPDEAERLKTQYGYAIAREAESLGSVEVHQIGQQVPRHLERRVLCEIIESRMKELAIMVRQEIESSGLHGLLPGGVILTGGGSELNCTSDLFDLTMKHMLVRSGRPRLKGPASNTANRPEWAGAAGMMNYLTDAQIDPIEPAQDGSNWKRKLMGLKSMFTAKAGA